MNPGDLSPSAPESESGQIAWPVDPERRFEAACQVAGVLAERGVQALTVSDPRACRSWTLEARRANLPRVLADCADGAVLSAHGLNLCLDGQCLRWVADAPTSLALKAIASQLLEDRSP